METFSLAVVRPVKGQSGELVCNRVVSANTITDAVRQVRNEFEGSGFVVMQSSAFKPSKSEVTPMVAALAKAYDEKSAKGWDVV